MEDNKLIPTTNSLEYDILLQRVEDTLEKGRQRVVNVVNSAMVQTCWEIGSQIVEYNQQRNEKVEYGSDVLNRLSRDLTDRYGKGFGRRKMTVILFFVSSITKLLQQKPDSLEPGFCIIR